MSHVKELSGTRFGRLTVVKLHEMGKIVFSGTTSVWECKCDCGSVVNVVRGSLICGGTRSCGCLKKGRPKQLDRPERHEQHERPIRPIRPKRSIVGLTSNVHLKKFLESWKCMIQRCTNPNRRSWRWYGSRGIRVCERWRTFKNFYEDMFPTWKSGLTIDRINNDGNYEPGNCRWATLQEQATNRRKRCVV